MSKLSTLGFPTTLGISPNKIPISHTYEKIEKKMWTGSDAKRFALHATADTEVKWNLVPVLVVEMSTEVSYLCAIRDNNTGFYIVRYFTKNPKKVLLAKQGCFTSLCASYQMGWCIDIDDGYIVPDWFWIKLREVVFPE